MYNGQLYSITSLRTTIRSWETGATKLSSFIGWRGSWRNPFLHFRVWLRQRNKIVDFRKNYPWQNPKTTPEVKTRNRGWINPRRDIK